MTAQLRPYQQQAKQAVMDYWAQGGGNPLVEMATGTGKSLVIGDLTRELVNTYQCRIIMLVHVRELVAQNFIALQRAWPGAPAGIYSAGLGRRDTHHKITFASIQSVFKKAKSFGPRDVILIDEAHLVPPEGEGMYQRFLSDMRAVNPDLRVAGFTATAYRMDSGRIDGGKGPRLFDETVFTYGIGDGIADGFLSPLVSKAGLSEIDVSSVAKRGGEFVAGDLETASDKITAQAVLEIHQFANDRKSWLIFCAGVKHAFNVRDALRATGITCETVTGDTTSGERDSILRRFKAGEIHALTNANVLTTGFDAPNVDLVVMLRPTLSTSLYVQIVGRGTRLFAGKENCLVLDFAGNVRRHGPVDAVSVGPKSGGTGDGEGKVAVDSVRAKACPQCESLAALNAISCKVCGHEWPRDEKPKHEATAEKSIGILSTEKVAPSQMPMVDWRFLRHVKDGSPDSVRVEYIAGLMTYREWLAFEHSGYGAQKAGQWWSNHGGLLPFPKTTDEAIARIDELQMPQTISVRPNPKNAKWFDIVGRSFAKKQEMAA